MASSGGEWYKDYPGLGNRLALYPYDSVGNTFTLDVVEDTQPRVILKTLNYEVMTELEELRLAGSAVVDP